MNPLSDELPVDVKARIGVVRAIAGTLLGHEIEYVRLEQAKDGTEQCVVFRKDPVTIPRWDGIVIDLAVKHMTLGCVPCFDQRVPQQCKSCIAGVALQQAAMSESRVHAQDVCEDAFHLISGREDEITELTRQLMLDREVTGQQVSRIVWPTGDPVAAVRYRV